MVNGKALGSPELPPFATSDTALAAWLLTNGFIYTHINHKPNPNRPLDIEAEFVFPSNSHKLDDLKDAFQAGEAYGNIVAYIRNYHILTQKAKARGNFR
jgi:hypothetical protein